METDEILKELAAIEKPCENMECPVGMDSDDLRWFALSQADNELEGIEPKPCSCKGTGAVPAFPMLRIQCIGIDEEDVGVYYHDNCCNNKRWRAKTLDEARLCLEELLVVYWKQRILEDIKQDDGGGMNANFFLGFNDDRDQLPKVWKFEYENGHSGYYEIEPPFPRISISTEGPTPTEAVLAALYEANRVKINA